MLTLAPARSQRRELTVYRTFRKRGWSEDDSLLMTLAIAKSERAHGREVAYVLDADWEPLEYRLKDFCPREALNYAVEVIADLTAQPECVPDVGERWGIKVDDIEIDCRVMTVGTVKGRILVVVRFERLWGAQ